jgi:DNA-binding response OmpR family regulator
VYEVESIESLDSIFVVGPLILDARTNVASTCWNVNIPLDYYEFHALLFLANHEDITIPFDEIFAGVWIQFGSIGNGKRKEALNSIKRLMRLVNAVGDGFMWIDESSAGYTFRTKWGHNKESWLIESKGEVM